MTEAEIEMYHTYHVTFTSEQNRVLEALAAQHGLNNIQFIKKAVLEEHLTTLNDELLAVCTQIVNLDPFYHEALVLAARAAIKKAKGGS